MQITFKATGWCSSVGNFANGTTADVPDALAAHLVDEVGCAERVMTQATVQETATPPAAAPRRTRKKTEQEADLAGTPRPE